MAEDEALAIGFSASGLRKLGLTADDLETFNPAFRDGMTASWRSTALGDTGANASDARDPWLWGRPGTADAVLLVYAASADTLASAIERRQREMNGKATIVHPVALQELPRRGERVYEPFGFADGLSQPILRDTPRARRDYDDSQVIESGEMVLGYPDNRGFLPPSPSVGACSDPDSLLPEAGTGLPASGPSFGGCGSNGRRDFGRNGTYMVVRQLEQDVQGFRKWRTKTARRLLAKPDCPWRLDLREMGALLEAKLMGRWRNGSRSRAIRTSRGQTATPPRTTSSTQARTHKVCVAPSAPISAGPIPVTGWAAIRLPN